MGKPSTGFSKAGVARIKADGRYHNGAFYVFSERREMAAGEWKISHRHKNAAGPNPLLCLRQPLDE